MLNIQVLFVLIVIAPATLYMIRVLEFDHVHGNKSASITNLFKNTAPWETIEAEIAKCEVRCVNCHRIKTSERDNWWRHLI